MPAVDVSKCPNVEVAIRRLKRAVEKDGLAARQRELESYTKPTTVRRLARIAARKRTLKVIFKERALRAQRSRRIKKR
jgi:small subunit ribosomal protein S21